MDAMFRGMSRFFWFVSFVTLVNCLDRLLWDTVPARNLFVSHRTAISRRSLRITRHRLLILIACAILLHGSIPLLQFHLRLIFNNFELVDLLHMLLGVRLVCSLAVSTEMCILVIMELLLYRSPKIHFLVEIILKVTINLPRLRLILFCLLLALILVTSEVRNCLILFDLSLRLGAVEAIIQFRTVRIFATLSHKLSLFHVQF